MPARTRLSASRVWGAVRARRRGEHLAPAASRSSSVSTSSTQRRRCSTPDGDAGGVARARVALAAAGAERRGDHVGRRQQRARSSRCRGGRGRSTTSGPSARLDSSPSTSRRVRASAQSPGSEQHAAAPRPAPSARRHAPPRCGPSCGSSAIDLGAVGRGRGPRRRLAGHDEHDVVDEPRGPQRLQHVGDHRLASARRGRRRSRRAQALLGLREALDRQHRDDAHAPCPDPRSASAASATRRRAVGVGHQRVGLTARGTPSRSPASSVTIAVERRRRSARAIPGRVARSARPTP